MESIRIDILNPKAKSLLKSLVDLNLIRKEDKQTDFNSLLKKLRSKAKDNISLDDITEEVEKVRKDRNEKK